MPSRSSTEGMGVVGPVGQPVFRAQADTMGKPVARSSCPRGQHCEMLFDLGFCPRQIPRRRVGSRICSIVPRSRALHAGPPMGKKESASPINRPRPL